MRYSILTKDMYSLAEAVRSMANSFPDLAPLQASLSDILQAIKDFGEKSFFVKFCQKILIF